MKEEGQEGPSKISTYNGQEVGYKDRNLAMGGRKLEKEKWNTMKRKRCTEDRL